VVDVQSLCGDSVDNVPGAPGIGIKTAAQLINEYGDLDTLLARAGEIKQPKRRETLIEFADQIRLSRELVKLDCDTPLPEPIDDLVVREPDKQVLADFLELMEFRSLARRVGDGNASAAPRTPRPPAATPDRAGAGRVLHGRGRPRRRQSGRRAGQHRHAAYVRIQDLETLNAWIAKATAKGSSPSTPRPTPCRRPPPACAACRWPSRRARPATSRSATARRTAWPWRPPPT
jgi:DNA polymerase-1